jgi:very-short-patch-repair endonuclease/predicted transcriptional regulator of viral defense system
MEHELAATAARQHGRAALWQLEELGLKRAAVRGRVRSGRLHRVHRGVYAVGHDAETPESALMTAVLACGRDAVLSHRSAAALIGLRTCTRGSVEVTVPGQCGRWLEGIDSHQSSTLSSSDRTFVNGIPCTTVARTLLDLADVVDRKGVERAIEEAERLRVFDRRKVNDVLEYSNGRRGASVLRAILATYEEPPLTQEELERLFLELCREAGIEEPRTQARIEFPEGDSAFVDFLWSASMLVVETDGRKSHGTPAAFERDRRRDRRLMMLGYRVVRFTWLDIDRRPEEVTRTLSALL